MIIIYSQDETIVRADVMAARDDMIRIYGKKLGEKAFATLKAAPVGTSYRKNGGPLIRLVSDDDAEKIISKEESIGMLRR